MTSILALASAAMRRRLAMTASSNDLVAGSNNAGGLMPSATTLSPPGRLTLGSRTGGLNDLGFARPSGIYQSGSPNSPMNQMSQMGANTTESPFNSQPVSFAAGGMVTPTGGASRPGAGMQEEVQLGQPPNQPIGGAQIDQEAQRFVQQHPEEVQKIQQLMAMALQSGELTTDELNMMVQLAKAALANPASYPQVRQFAIQNGLGTEAEIPPQMDEGMLYVLLVAGKAMQSGAPQGGGNAIAGEAPAPNGVVPEYKEGGMTGDKPHIAKVHPREYIVPEDALIYHGKKHFDKLVEQARTPPDAKQQG